MIDVILKLEARIICYDSNWFYSINSMFSIVLSTLPLFQKCKTLHEIASKAASTRKRFILSDRL